MPGRKLPSTIKRSSKKAQDTYAKTLKSAVKQYGDGERAHRTALASLKHGFEKVGDHWEKKAKNGPSDRKAAEGRNSTAKSAEGVDARASKNHLIKVAKRLGITGRTTMKKPQLVKAIQKANRRKSATSLRKK